MFKKKIKLSYTAIFTLISITAASVYTVLETVTYRSLKDHVELLEAKITELESNINGLNSDLFKRDEIIAELQNKIEKCCTRIPPTPSRKKVDKKKLHQLQVLISKANALLTLDPEEPSSYEKFKKWKQETIIFLNSVDYALQKELLARFEAETFLSKANYPLLHKKITAGKWTLEKVLILLKQYPKI